MLYSRRLLRKGSYTTNAPRTVNF